LRSDRGSAGWTLGLALVLLPALTGALEVSTTPSVRVDGALPKSGTLGPSELEKLGATTLAWTSHGQTHQVTGVRLDKVLTHFGFTPGPMGKDVPVKEKVKGYRQVLVATARDGFQAVFTCAEVTEGMGTTVALVVWQVDGKPLGPDAGPLRLVVLSDGEPARSIRQLERLHVIDAT
jgi:DMSO/TMAO reductase YedYZ molybdopterin-dependent catalytic subunit